MPSPRPSRKAYASLAKACLWLLGAALFSPSNALTLKKRAPPTKLPEWATDNDRRHQPALGKLVSYNHVITYMFSDC